MGVLADLTGQKFGRLIGIHRVENHGRITRWLWLCDCGNQKIIAADKVKSGHTASCGCLWTETCRKHGHGHDANGQQTRTYKAWVNMRSRVSGRYDIYEGSYTDRGIAVCERWEKSFRSFLEDMGECPDGMTLDREDNDGDYEPDNCRWATQHEQTRNTRRTRTVSFQGRRLCLQDAATLAGIHPATVHYRLNSGMSVEEALTRTPRIRRKKLVVPLMEPTWLLSLPG